MLIFPLQSYAGIGHFYVLGRYVSNWRGAHIQTSQNPVSREFEYVRHFYGLATTHSCDFMDGVCELIV